jgi:hypothetical protein
MVKTTSATQNSQTATAGARSDLRKDVMDVTTSPMAAYRQSG